MLMTEWLLVYTQLLPQHPLPQIPIDDELVWANVLLTEQ